MTQYLLKNYLVVREIAERFVKKLSSEKISELLNEYSEEILDSRRRNLIYRYLVRNLDMLQGLLEEAESNENK